MTKNISDYATEYARLIDQAGIDAGVISEMACRLEFVVGTEITSEERSRFLKSFRAKLDTQHHHAFSRIVLQLSTEDLRHEMNTHVVDDDGVESTSREINGRIDFLSVNQSARGQANMMT